MKNWKTFLVLALVFLAGLVVGIVGTRIVVRRLVQQAITHPELVQTHIERELTWKLRLDNTQQASLHTILTETRGRLQELRQEYQPQAATALRATDQKIAALLTPEQQACYEKVKQENGPLWRVLRAGGK